jgi:hypothetical protein
MLQRRQLIDLCPDIAFLHARCEIRSNCQTANLVRSLNGRRAGAEADVRDDLSGTEPPSKSAPAGFPASTVAPGVLGQGNLDRHLAVRQREFGAVLLDVAEGRDADRLARAAVVTPRSAARSKRGLMVISG